jgi:hypothetical protein
MSYIQNFKKFIKTEEKPTEMGANPQVVAEEAVAGAPPTDPALLTQYNALTTKNNELLALQKQVVMKQDEINKAKAAYDQAVLANTKAEATKAANAPETPTTPTT